MERDVRRLLSLISILTFSKIWRIQQQLENTDILMCKWLQEDFALQHFKDFQVAILDVKLNRKKKDLKDYMRQAGEVTYADAHKQRRNEGAVEFASLSDMKNAIEKLDDTELNGRRITLREDKSRSSRRRSRSRSTSRSRSRSRSKGRRDSKSHSESKSRSRSRSRSKTRSRSKSASPVQHDKSRSHSRSLSKDRKESKSRSQSKSGSRSPPEKRIDDSPHNDAKIDEPSMDGKD